MINSLDEIKSMKLKIILLQRLKKRELMSKKLSKCISSFDYFDKSLVTLFATSGSISIASFEAVIGGPIQIESASFSLLFLVSTGIVKKLLKTARNK